MLPLLLPVLLPWRASSEAKKEGVRVLLMALDDAARFDEGEEFAAVVASAPFTVTGGGVPSHVSAAASAVGTDLNLAGLKFGWLAYAA